MSTCPGLNVRWSTYYVHSSTAVRQWLPHLFLSVWYERKYESIVVYKPNRLFYLISLIISTYKTLTFSHTLSVMRSLISHCAYSFKKKYSIFILVELHSCIQCILTMFTPYSYPNSSQIHSHSPFPPRFLPSFYCI